MERKLPQVFLTYSSEEKLGVGQIVKAPIGSSEVAGVIYCEVKSENLEKEKIKKISSLYPLVLDDFHLEYIKLFAYNTLNSLNEVFKAFWLPLKNFSQKDLLTFEEYQKSAQKKLKHSQNDEKSFDSDKIANYEIKRRTVKPVDIGFTLDPQIFLRIMILIRNEGYKLPGETLIIVPEKKLLTRLINHLKSETKSDNFINILEYTGDQKKSNRNTLLEILNPESQSHNIICATRKALFLPYKQLKHIILIDESNSFYIQDQNSLYYDARDAAVQLAQSWNVKIDFLSSVPSIRLHNFYSESILKDWSSNISQKEYKTSKIELKERIPFSKDFSYILEDIVGENEVIHEIQEESDLTSEDFEYREEIGNHISSQS